MPEEIVNRIEKMENNQQELQKILAKDREEHCEISHHENGLRKWNS